MHREHFILLFFLFFLFVGSSIFVKQKAYEMAKEEKDKLDNALLTAADSAAAALADAYAKKGEGARRVASEQFFRTLYVCLDAEDSEERKQEIDLYVPALVTVETDGFYVCCLERLEQENGEYCYAHLWSECQPYYYADEAFVYRICLDDRVYAVQKATGIRTETSYSEVMGDASLQAYFSAGTLFRSEAAYRERKLYAIAGSVEQGVGRAVNTHNSIAGQCGLSVWFHTPEFFQSFTPAMENPSVIALFQGWPLSADGKLLYSNCAAASSYIKKAAAYLLELPGTEKSTDYAVYHKEGCGYAGSYGALQSFTVTKEEAVTIYGAYACPHCFFSWEDVAILP